MQERTIELTSGERLRISVDRDAVQLENPGAWHQRMTREDAWRLAEALDELATSAAEEAELT